MKALNLLVRAGFPIEGVIHIGANEGQERFEYLEAGVSPCIYVEPISEVFSRLQANIAGMDGHLAVQAVCDERAGETVTFNIANNAGLSSSILPLGDHALFHPSVTYAATEEMVTTTVDELLQRNPVGGRPSLLVIDTQGAELRVLRGAKRTLGQADAVFVEVSETPLYVGGASLADVCTFMAGDGFVMRWMDLDAHGHGDAFFCRVLGAADTLPVGGVNHALNKPARQSSVSVWSTDDDAAGAVNGRKMGSYGFHTERERNPWWEVDLGETIDVTEVRIFNRVDVARERANTLKVLVSADGADWKLIHDQGGRSFGGADGRPLRLPVKTENVRLVRLQLEAEETLHLDEVEVYGTPAASRA